MQKKYKRAIAVTTISLVILTLVLVLLGLGQVGLDQYALNYSNIAANYSDSNIYGPGLYYIGIANSFYRTNKNQQTISFNNLQTFSIDFYQVTANLQVTVQFNFSNSFSAISNYQLLFGDNPLEFITPLIKNQIIIILSSQNSTFYQQTSQANSLIETMITTQLQSVLGQWVPATVNVIIESIICVGTTTNTEIIDREIQSLIHDQQRSEGEQIELTSYFNSIYANKAMQIASASLALQLKTKQLQRIMSQFGSSQSATGLNLSVILYNNEPLKYNLNLVNILQELAIISNRTFPY